MKHKLGICIPYRNRKEHLESLIPHLSNYLNKNNIDYHFYVGHQIDDKLLNRGALKNIAAHYAFNDGCDYIAWHDVDMLPHDDCDYSYPDNFPIHIATKLSKYNYTLGYDQYFGGVILFNKEQVEKTNGYSNGYWDWGQEDDDLFWRCYYENLLKQSYFKSYKDKNYITFNGDTSYVSFPTNREISSLLRNNHTISILFKAQHNIDKYKIWLVGDKDKQFVEYPIIRKKGSWNWGLSFNNSRALSVNLYGRSNEFIYNWIKRFEDIWTWVTLSYSEEENKINFYLNNELIRNINGVTEKLPQFINVKLKSHDNIGDFLLGYCNQTNVYFKGDISEVKFFNEFYDVQNINNIFDDKENKNLILHYDFSNIIDNNIIDNVSNIKVKYNDIKFNIDNIDVTDSIIPHRKEGSFICLHHDDEGLLNGNRWAKGETTAKNERRLVMDMQQRKINYKTDGINDILNVLTVSSVDNNIYNNTTIINVIMK